MTKRNLVIVGLAVIFLFYIPIVFMSGPAIVDATLEDHFYENATAIFFFIGAAGFAYAFFKGKSHNIFYLLFALFLFFAGGEEISWGQRIFNFATPASMDNAQGEFNVHNLSAIQHESGFSGTLKSLMNFNRLFIVFYLIYAILVPLANQYVEPVRRLLAKIRLPIVSLWFGLLFVINEVACKVIELVITGRVRDATKVAEVKESLWAIIMTLMALYFVYVYARQVALKKEVRVERATAS